MTNANPNNVTSITDKQPAPAARFTVAASLDGFPVQVFARGSKNYK